MFTGPVSKEWELEVELKITETEDSWTNVLSFGADGVGATFGQRSPSGSIQYSQYQYTVILQSLCGRMLLRFISVLELMIITIPVTIQRK